MTTEHQPSAARGEATRTATLTAIPATLPAHKPGLRLLVCALGLLMAGCSTQLTVVRVKDGAVPGAGAPYNLTFTQYDIAVTRRVTACPSATDPALVVTVEATATHKEARDPQRDYVIDFADLRSFFKTSDVTVDYHPNGALKSINATVKDETGAVLASAFSSVGKLAGAGLLGLGGPAIMSGAAPAKPAQCTGTVLSALGKIKTLESQVKAATRDLTDISADLDRLTAMAQAMGRAWGRDERNELKKQIDAMYRARKQLGELNLSLKAEIAKVALVDTLVWPPDGETLISAAPVLAALTAEQIDKWGENLTIANLQALATDTAVWARLRATSNIGRRAACPQNICPDDSLAGLKYRMPAPGILELCSVLPPASAAGTAQQPCDPAAVVGSDAGLVSQLGPVFALQLKNYPFMDQTISATFNDAGQPTTLGFRSAAAAPGVAGALGGLVDQTLAVRAALKPKSALDKLKDETELLKAQAELAAAKKALEPPKFADQVAAADGFTADATVAEAELAKLQADAALAAARALTSKP